MTLLEGIASAFGLACVYLTLRQNVWCWPTGLVQVCLYVWIFFQARLYSDFLLHIFYVGLQFYGWHAWLRGGPRRTKLVAIDRLRPIATGGWLGVAVVGTVALGDAMDRWTNAERAYVDASIAVLSLIATYLLARKVLENWLVWIVVDVIAIGLFTAKELYVTAGLYTVFLVLAVIGWFSWRKSYKQQTSRPNSDTGEGFSSASSSPRTAATSSSSSSPASTSVRRT